MAVQHSNPKKLFTLLLYIYCNTQNILKVKKNKEYRKENIILRTLAPIFSHKLILFDWHFKIREIFIFRKKNQEMMFDFIDKMNRFFNICYYFKFQHNIIRKYFKANTLLRNIFCEQQMDQTLRILL